jgi:hypothetical protein
MSGEPFQGSLKGVFGAFRASFSWPQENGQTPTKTKVFRRFQPTFRHPPARQLNLGIISPPFSCAKIKPKLNQIKASCTFHFKTHVCNFRKISVFKNAFCIFRF